METCCGYLSILVDIYEGSKTLRYFDVFGFKIRPSALAVTPPEILSSKCLTEDL